ncbi:hypothetical protein KI387_017492, partial [Taxus chinensis]
MYLLKMDEDRMQVFDRISAHQLKVKSLFDKKARPKYFQVGDIVLLWDKRHESRGSH